MRETCVFRKELRNAHEYLAAVVVRDQIEIALTVSLLDVGESVEFFRQGTQRFAEESELVHFDRKLAGARRERFAGHADDVAEIKFLEDLEIIFPDLVALNVNLHSAGRVFDIRENGFSHGAECRHAACDRDFLLLFRFRFEVLPDICGHLHIVEASSEGQNACGSEILNFCRALRENILGLLLGSILNVFFAHSQISFPKI